MKKRYTHITVCFVFILFSTIAQAERIVIVNGQQLNQEQINNLEQIHCGPIANGNYWLDLNTGIWGYAGSPTPQGYITDPCYQQQQRRPGLSERGLLYSPGELLR